MAASLWVVLQYHTEHSLKILCATSIYPFFPLVTPDLLADSIVVPFSRCHRVGIIQYATLSWDFNLARYIQNSSMAFHGLIPHFFLFWGSGTGVWTQSFSLATTWAMPPTPHLISFYWWVIFYYLMYKSLSLYLRASWLLPSFGNCEYNYYEHKQVFVWT
jgi:hypothetical protein